MLNLLSDCLLRRVALWRVLPGGKVGDDVKTTSIYLHVYVAENRQNFARYLSWKQRRFIYTFILRLFIYTFVPSQTRGVLALVVTICSGDWFLMVVTILVQDWWLRSIVRGPDPVEISRRQAALVMGASQRDTSAVGRTKIVKQSWTNRLRNRWKFDEK